MCKYAFLSILLGISIPGFAGTYFLDFNDGLLPSAHGWNIFLTPEITEAQVWSVSAGVLTGNTIAAAGQNGTYYFLPNAYDPNLPSVFEIRARHLGGSDEAATAFAIEGPQYWTMIGIGNGYLGASITAPDYEVFINIGDTTQFRTYRLEMAPGNGFTSFFVDGVLVYQSLPRLQSSQSPSALFGDMTSSGGTEGWWEIDSVYYSNDPVPEPATLISVSIALVALLGIRRKS